MSKFHLNVYRKLEYVFYSSQLLIWMFISIAFVLFFHHHVNNDAYFLKRGVSIYYLISEKKVEQKVTQKNFNQHVILENLRWVYSYYTKIQCVFYTLINSYFIPYGHILRNFLLVYKTFDMFRVWVGKLFHDPFMIIVASVFLLHL